MVIQGGKMHKSESRTRIASFWEHCYDRQLIWHKRTVQDRPWPWAVDRTLQRYHLLNVYRLLDKNSQYLVENVLRQNIPDEMKLFNIYFYRLFNRSGIYGHGLGLLDPDNFHFDKLEEYFDAYAQNGRKLFNNSYLVTGRAVIDAGYRPRDKHIQVLLNLKLLAPKIADLTRSLKEAELPKHALKLIMKIPFVADFLGTQIFLDLTYFNFFPEQWTSNSIQVIYPGFRDAIRFLRDMPDYPYYKYADTCIWLRDQQEKAFQSLMDRTGKDWLKIAYRGDNSPTNPYLGFMDIQRCVLQFKKLHDIQTGVGHHREYYKYRQLLEQHSSQAWQ